LASIDRSESKLDERFRFQLHNTYASLNGAVALAAAAVLLLSGMAAYAQGGPATLMVVNYVGSELSFTLDGVQCTVPAAAADQPGQATYELQPGKHEFSGAVPGGPGANGIVELDAGQTFVLGARLDTTPARISPEGKVIEKPRDVLILFEASLTPPVPPQAATRVPLQALPAGFGALVFDNYIGEELVLDVQGEVYRVAADGRLQLNLAAGEYRYSASAGISGTSGSAMVTAGQYTGLGFSREVLPEPVYEVGKPKPTVAIPRLLVSPVDLSYETSVGAP
jgi:hypothetical protein